MNDIPIDCKLNILSFLDLNDFTSTQPLRNYTVLRSADYIVNFQDDSSYIKI